MVVHTKSKERATQPVLLRESTCEEDEDLDDSIDPVVLKLWHLSSPASFFLGSSRGQSYGLFVIATVFILLCSMSWSLAGGSEGAGADASFQQAIWISWGLFFDPGTQTGVPADDPQNLKFVAVLFSILGFIWNLVVLGLVVDVIKSVLDRWKAVYSRVVERHHAVILGWGDRTLYLMCELVWAYEEKHKVKPWWRRQFTRRRPIVVLSPENEIDMMQLTFEALEEKGLTADGISFRTGDPTDWRELNRVSTTDALDVIIMGRWRDMEQSDQGVLQTLLALASLHSKKPLREDCEVFAEMRCADNLPIVKQFYSKAEAIMCRQAVCRVLVMCSLRPIVGKAFRQLCSFEGNHILLNKVPDELVGQKFETACHSFPNAVVLGLKPNKQQPAFIRDSDYILQEKDRLMFIADNHQHTESVTKLPNDSGKLPKMVGYNSCREIKTPLVIIVLGCPLDFPDFFGVLHLTLPEGSTVHILSPRDDEWRQAQLLRNFGEKDPREYSFTLVTYVGTTTSSHFLCRLPLEKADSILVLAESWEGDASPGAVDARNLDALVTLHHCVDKDLKPTCVTVCELVDARSIVVARTSKELGKLAVYFNSNAVETSVFACATEDRSLYNLLMLLQQPKSGSGNLIRRSIGCYLDATKDTEYLSFYDLHRRVMSVDGSLLLGWKRLDNKEKKEDACMNPMDKTTRQDWNRNNDGESLIMLAKEVDVGLAAVAHDVILPLVKATVAHDASARKQPAPPRQLPAPAPALETGATELSQVVVNDDSLRPAAEFADPAVKSGTELEPAVATGTFQQSAVAADLTEAEDWSAKPSASANKRDSKQRMGATASADVVQEVGGFTVVQDTE